MSTVIEKVKGVLRRKPKQLDLVDYVNKMKSKGYDEQGNFIMDPTPIAPPIGYKKHPSMVELIREMVQSERLAQEARDAGAETLEESLDFDIDDDPAQLESPHAHPEDFKTLLAAGEQELKRKPKRQAGEGTPSDGPSVAQEKASDPPSDGPATPPKAK